jgi:hypothetical protein
MRRWLLGALALSLVTAACRSDTVVVVADPAPPRSLDGFYQAGSVILTWELHPDWNGESFRVYGKRTTDADFFLIAEVTSCAGGFCTYTDVNVVGGISYRYFVSAVSLEGLEAASGEIEIFVPVATPPPAPLGVDVVALDGTAYVRWDANARAVDDFSFYRIYLADPSGDFLLGETDSEGFVDQLVSNGTTYTYFVTSVDVDGHESGASATASGTPRPDFHGELVYAYEDVPAVSGFRFQSTELSDPVVPGDSPLRHFRVESDGFGWWIVPGPGAEITIEGVFTTALRCGVAADTGCQDLSVAPPAGYTTAAVFVAPELTYAMRVVGDDGQIHYGAVRVALLGFDQTDAALMIFDWSYQLQPGNPELVPGS